MDNSPIKERRIPWFGINVAMLCVLAPWATYWFQRHLQLYFTEIVVVGGAISLWVLLRGMWAILEKAGRVDVWEHSRKLLASSEVTGVLLVLAIVFIVLWFRTASIYVQYQGAPGEGEYLVEVVRKSDGSPLIGSVSLNAGHSVVGMPIMWQGSTMELECRILRPVKYEALPCALQPGVSTRIDLPGRFHQKEFHLLRVIPGGSLYIELAGIDDSPARRYELQIQRGTESVTVTDLRRQVVYTGAPSNEMPILMELEQPRGLERQVRMKLRAKGFDADSAEMTTAILASATRQWPSMHLKQGDKLTLTVRARRPEDAADKGEIVEGFPVSYVVSDAKVQTLWLPSN